MQVSATLIAAQQAAREARARMALPPAQPAAKANFASALQELGATPAPQAPAAAAPATTQPAQQPAASGRLGQHINILV